MKVQTDPSLDRRVDVGKEGEIKVAGFLPIEPESIRRAIRVHLDEVSEPIVC